MNDPNYFKDKEWAKQAWDNAHNIAMNCNFPWTNREKRLWYVGVLAYHFPRAYLELASISQLQDDHNMVYGVEKVYAFLKNTVPTKSAKEGIQGE